MAPTAKKSATTKKTAGKDKPAASRKRKGTQAAPEQRVTKKTKLAGRASQSNSKPVKTVQRDAKPKVVHLNDVPTEVLTILVVGGGDCGELGLGPRVVEVDVPVVNPYLDANNTKSEFRVVQIACGGMHSIAITEDNQIITWGVNDNLALGRDTEWDSQYVDIDAEDSDDGSVELNPHESVPRAIAADKFPPGTRFAQVAAGDSCSLALTTEGTVFAWGAYRDGSGHNEFGYDAKGNFIPCQKDPSQIQGLQNIVQIACGANHALALDSTGAIWGWGAYEQNQLGRRLFGRHTQHLVPRRVELFRKKAKYIASGQYHAFAIDQNDNVWSWGLNAYGQAGFAGNAGSDAALLPYPMKIAGLCGKNVQSLDGGAHHSAAVTADGELLVWGRLDGGQLGVQFTDEQLQDEDLILRDDRDNPRVCLRPTTVSTIGAATNVACGTDHTIFVNEQGEAYASGFNSSGQLGIESDDDADVATKMRGKAMRAHKVNWAGAGGQFSMVAGPSFSDSPTSDACIGKMEL